MMFVYWFVCPSHANDMIVHFSHAFLTCIRHDLW
jgi:hypothetical protein